MRVGFIGAGAVAEHHLGVLGTVPAVEISAVCDLDERLAAEVARRTGAQSFADWKAMIDAVRLDALFVCTPPAHHAAPAIAAFDRGLPVYLEKPLARTLADGEAIAAAWQQSGVVCAVGYQWRSLDVLRELRALLRGLQPGLLVSRSFGPTEGARRDLERAAGWLADPAASGGLLFEMASHDVDLQIALAGPVESVQATAESGLLALAGRPGSALDDAIAVLLRFVNGGIGTAHVAWSSAQRPPLYALDVQAADTALQLTLDPAFELRGHAAGEAVAVTGDVPPRVSSVTRFLDAVRSGDPGAVPCSPADALSTLAALVACEQAIASGERVAV
ncbi:MAG: Gfo/Idh/MocA family oxidoreductase [Actinomycetota bacterium]|nr:Gfo/Idh/MocA family oxidoreductase [Actinomycetota bacterium]